MEEIYISLETAKLTKKKGFNIPVKQFINEVSKIGNCILPSTFYPDGDGVCEVGGEQLLDFNSLTYLPIECENSNVYYNKEDIFIFYSAPTQSLLQRWLREVHKIHINPITYQKVKEKYDVIMTSKDLDDVSVSVFTRHGWYNTYEEALEIGLQEALKLIK